MTITLLLGIGFSQAADSPRNLGVLATTLLVSASPTFLVEEEDVTSRI